MEGVIRKATAEDRPAIVDLIAKSARRLCGEDYSETQIESALETGVFGVDSTLIDDGTYFAFEIEGRLVGCGGWSKRRTLFGGDGFTRRDAEMLDPRAEPAKIRAFFVHPDWARRGIGRRILERCESEALAQGFHSLEMMATLPGVRMYRALGYDVGEGVQYEMDDGVSIEFVRMSKSLDRARDPQ